MKKKSSEAVKLGRRGGLARAKSQSKRKLSEIGRKGAAARWGKRKSKSKEIEP